MIYSPENAAGSEVYWVKDGVESQMDFVLHVDMYRKEVVHVPHPVQSINGELVTKTTSFEFISCFHEEGTRYTFKCYGRC